MSNQLFMLDPMAASSYGIYNAYKGKDGSFEDFLLNYNSHEANDGDNSWFNKLIGDDLFQNIQSPLALKALSFSKINTSDFFQSKSYFETQVYANKLKLIEEMGKRDIPIPPEAKL